MFERDTHASPLNLPTPIHPSMTDDLVPLREAAPTSITARVKRALAPVVATAVPGVLMGAIYLATGTHWEVLKATLAEWGVSPAISVFFAPVVGVLAVLGVRNLIRFVRGTDDASSG